LNTAITRTLAVGIVTPPQVSLSPPVEFSRIGRTEANPATRRRAADSLPDGRILGVAANAQVATPGAPADQIVVVLNWFDELRSRVR
jgi:hypothetical protein